MRIGNRTRHILGAIAVASLLGGVLPAGAAAAAPSPTAPSPTAATASTAAASSTDAVAYQENATHDGLAGGAALPAALRLAWRRNLGGPASYPVVVGGRMFVTVGRPSGTVAYGLDAATGRTLWGPLSLSETALFAAMTYSNGRLFVVDNAGLLQALDPATGARLWSRALPGQYAFSSTPVAAAGLVFTGGAGTGGTLYAVSQKTGALVWTQTVENGDNSSPAVAAGHVYVSYACAFTYDFTTAGAPVWSRNDGCEGGGGSTPVVHGSTVWVRDGFSSPLVLSTVDDSVVRSFVSDTPPAFAGSQALLLPSGTLTATSASTGRVQWSQAGDGGLDTAPVISGSTAYVGSSTGTVTGFDLVTGHVVWSARTGAAISGWVDTGRGIPQNPAVGDGYLVVPTASTLVAYH